MEQSGFGRTGKIEKRKKRKKVDVWRVSYYFVQKVSLSYLK